MGQVGGGRLLVRGNTLTPTVCMCVFIKARVGYSNPNNNGGSVLRKER